VLATAGLAVMLAWTAPMARHLELAAAVVVRPTPMPARGEEAPMVDRCAVAEVVAEARDPAAAAVGAVAEVVCRVAPAVRVAVRGAIE